MMWFLIKYDFFNPIQMIFHGTHWIQHWSLLQKEGERPQIKWGCDLRPSSWKFLQQMAGFLAMESRFSFISFLFMLEPSFISFGLPNTEVWVVIMDRYMHWPMWRLEYWNIFHFLKTLHPKLQIVHSKGKLNS
jgi:hypothetical protein